MKTPEQMFAMWNIPCPKKETIVLQPIVIVFLKEWTETGKDNILLTEATGLDAASSADAAAWAIRTTTRCNRIRSFVYRVNGIELWQGKDFQPSPGVTGKMEACDLLWIEELTGGELTEHQKTGLYSLLLHITHQSRGRTIISVSTSLEKLGGWVGEVIAKILIRNFRIVQI